MAQSVETTIPAPDLAKEDSNPAEKSPNSSSCSSPDGKCAICLGKLENKSFTDSCFHTFCFTCLQEWSKVRPECPLCKQRFNSIIHTVRSNDQYEKYDLAAHQPQNEDPTWYRYSATRRFRYHTTLTAERRQRIAWLERLSNYNSHSYNPRLHWRYRRQPATSDFRRHVYNNNLWVQPTTGRVRDISPYFYLANPACLHRLVPWLNRELNVLLHNYESHVNFVLELILSLLPRFEIFSEEFREHISPFLAMQTAHFLHEFHNFARSPFDMIAYDTRVTYPDYNRVEVIDLSPENNSRQKPATQPVSTITISSSSSDSETNDFLDKCEKNTTLEIITKVKKFLEGGSYDTDNKLNVKDENSKIKSQSPTAKFDQPGPSGLQNNVKKLCDTGWESDSSLEPPVKKLKEDNDDDSESSSIVVVDCLKPKKERTPDLITLESESNDDETATPSEQTDASASPKQENSKEKMRKHKKKKHKHKLKKHRKKSPVEN